MTLWEIDIYPAEGQPDRAGAALASDAHDLGLSPDISIDSVRGYLIQGDFTAEDARRIARELLADTVVERTVVAQAGAAELAQPPAQGGQLIHVLFKPGVMDPVAQSALGAIADFGYRAEAVRTFRKYWVRGAEGEALSLLCSRLLANDSIEQVISGPLHIDHLQFGSPYQLHLVHVPLRQLDDAGLRQLSIQGQLYLTLPEMQAIQEHFRQLDRDPTDIELETLAQTWSEHCSHKTLAGRIEYRDEQSDAAIREYAARDDLRGDAGRSAGS